MQFHPLAESYPLMPEAELQVIVESMKADGYDNRFPIVKYKGKILDGRNRYKAALLAKRKPVFINFNGTPEEAEAFVKKANEDRRHLSPEYLRQKRDERIARVAEARKGGQSIRTIAGEEGVSKSQVERDLEEARQLSPPGTVEPESGKITGKDNRERPARAQTRPPKDASKLCDRCNRIAPGVGIKDCPACKDLNRTDRPAGKAKAEANGHADPDAPVDAFGTTIPEKRRDAFCDPWIQKTIDYLAPLVAAFWGEKHANGMHKRARHYPFFNAKDFIDGCAMAGNTLEQLLEHLKEFRPAGVCPLCGGKGCADCKLSGLVPRKLYAELKKKAKDQARAEKEAVK